MLSPELFSLWMSRFCAFYHRSLTPDLQEIYYESVREFSDHEFERISRKIFENETFFPVAGTYRKYRKEIVRDIAELHWGQILRELQLGKISVAECDFSEDVKDAIARMGGLRHLAYAETNDMPKLQREFTKHFGYTSGLVPLPDVQKMHLMGGDGLTRLNPEIGLEF